MGFPPIILNIVPQLTSRFWKASQKDLGTQVKHSTPFRPQTDGKVEYTIPTLEDMLSACVIDLKGSLDDHLLLIGFSYNSSYHSSISILPFEALYGRRCSSL